MNYNSTGAKAIVSHKKVIISCLVFIALLLGSVIAAKAQTVQDKYLKDTTITKKHDGKQEIKTYKIYQGKRGGKYILMTAKSSGNVYKKYFKK